MEFAIRIAWNTQHPSWGPRKLKALLEHRLTRAFPSHSAISRILNRHNLVKPRKRPRRYPPTVTLLREANGPNDVWCIDYKGQFRLGDKTYCYPLTLTDQYSRFILGCDAMGAISDAEAREACQEVFGRYGLPMAIRSDNGVPFSSSGLAGLTKLSVFWVRLGITLERIRPGHPEENGQHERMHRTLKFETARPARSNILQQQERFDQFVEEFNCVRPHEALGMKRPSDLYFASKRPMPNPVPEPSYTTFDDVLRVNRSGQIYFAGGIGTIKLSASLAGEYVGIREEHNGRWLINFCGLNLGYAGPERKAFVPSNLSTPPEGNRM